MRLKTLLRPAAAAVLALASALPAAAHEQIFTAILTGANEAPPNASEGLGVAIITFDLDLFTMHVQTTFAGLTGETTASHIHCCTATPGTGNAGVATQVPTFQDFPLGVNFGSYDWTFDMALASSYNPAFIAANGGTVSTAFSALLGGAGNGNAYLNIHTTFAPGGEIRGFLTPVPEAPAAAMLAGGLLVTGWLARRRRAA